MLQFTALFYSIYYQLNTACQDYAVQAYYAWFLTIFNGVASQTLLPMLLMSLFLLFVIYSCAFCVYNVYIYALYVT